jgi:DNA invertase Pin-like site-specific DNA recombinase
MKAIIYCRVSTNKETQESSLKRQEEELMQLANTYHFEIDRVIKEKASGYDFNREGIFQLLERIRDKQVQAL